MRVVSFLSYPFGPQHHDRQGNDNEAESGQFLQTGGFAKNQSAAEYANHRNDECADRSQRCGEYVDDFKPCPLAEDDGQQYDINQGQYTL